MFFLLCVIIVTDISVQTGHEWVAFMQLATHLLLIAHQHSIHFLHVFAIIVHEISDEVDVNVYEKVSCISCAEE